MFAINTRDVKVFLRSFQRKKTLVCLMLSAALLVLCLVFLATSSPFRGSHLKRITQDFIQDGYKLRPFVLISNDKSRLSSKDNKNEAQTMRREIEDLQRVMRLRRHAGTKDDTTGDSDPPVVISVTSTRDEGDRLPPCPALPTGLKGNQPSPDYWESWPLLTPSQIASLYPELRDGGQYTPTSCLTEQRTAIIIPYRERWDHLHMLLPVLIPMLIRQQIDFTIYVVEQDSDSTFNKGILFNAGFLEASNADKYDCFILHDVDMIPLDDRNIYKCSNTGPVHFSAGVNKFNYNSSYTGLFGGVVSFTREQFQAMNGASNMYFGWGAEDDDLRDRALNKGYVLNRKPIEHGVYDMIEHKGASGWSKNSDRFKVFAQRLKRQDIDGLNSVLYTVTAVGVFPIYTWINVHFDADEIKKTVPEHLWKAKKDSYDYKWAPIKAIKS